METEDDADLERRARAQAHYGSAIILEMDEQVEEALEEYGKAIDLDPENETLAFEVSRRYLQAQRPEEAVRVLRRASEHRGASGELFARLAAVLAQMGRREEALAASREALRRSPLLLPPYQHLFMDYLQRQQYEEAGTILDNAARQTNAPPEFLIALAELYVALGVQSSSHRETARAEAIKVLHRADDLHPESVPVRLVLADHLNALGETRRASEIYLDLLKSAPEAPGFRERVHAKLTDIYLRSRDHKAAMEQLREIVGLDPTNPQAYYFLGMLAMDEKQPAEAADYFGKTVLLKPDFEQAYYDLANAQLAAGRVEAAQLTLGSARETFKPSFLLEYLSAAACQQRKAYQEAVRYYTAAEVIARASEPKLLTHFFLFQAGAASERAGQYAEAEKYFEQCLEQSPDFAEALNYLGYMWVERGIHLERARDMIAKALEKEPENDAFLDSMGWVLFRLNEPREALDYLLKAVQHAETPDATVLDHLGDVYQALGDPVKARESWEKSLAVEENEAVRRKLEPNR